MINRDSGKRAFAVSGQANNSRNDGAFYVKSSYSLNSANNTYGSQRCYLVNIPSKSREPQPLLKHKENLVSVSSKIENSEEL